ncbi:MAG: ATP-binding protein, partial [Ruminiclostridium sp.]
DYSSAPRLCEALVKYVFEENSENPLKSQLRLRKYFAVLLSSDRFFTDYSYMKLSALKNTGYICYEQQYREICGIMSSGRRLAVSLFGRKGSGRKHLLKQCAAVTGNPVLFVNCGEYAALSDDEKNSADKDIICVLMTRQCYFCVTDIPESTDSVLKRLCRSALKAASMVFLIGETCCSPDLEIPEYSVKLPELSAEQRYSLWREQGFEQEFMWEIADKFRFTPKQIKQAASAVSEKLRLGEKAEESLFDLCCGRLTESCMGDKAQLIESKFTLDDLVLPENEKQLLREACAHVKYRHVVYDKWNFGSRLAYGKGLTLLFAGPPGTGKTMAATIIAGELGLPAYRVDISQVMSKYIGETEKSLGEIFDVAQQSNAILFFDETDALFGKRSEIKDSHDKYANVETSFLLQKLESFDGVVLMSTNLLQNIDSAFMRRISYVINFPFPDRDRRLELWKRMFPSEMPVDSGIDFDYLAGQFELSGAEIKNTVMSAAFLAASENAPVNMSHILKAVSKQLSKQGRLTVKEDFGKYSMFL